MKIRLRAGDVLIFRGDLVHTGAALMAGDAANLEVEGVVRPKYKDGVEETYFMCDEEHILKRWS
jgi:hypothetical protein